MIIGNRIQPFTCQTRVKIVYAECSRHGCYILHKHTFSNDSATSITISESPGDSEIVSDTSRTAVAKVCFLIAGKESVLSVILIVNSFKRSLTDGAKFMTLIRGCLREKLALIPEAKLLITNSFSSVMEKEEIPRETLQLYLPRRIVLASLLELLNKRWKTMDLISVMLELKRTFVTRGETIFHEEEELPFLFLDDYTQAKMDENLSCLPRLQKTELVDRDK